MSNLADNVLATIAFPLFNYLPKELRLQVWKSALPDPRIIYVQRLLTSGNDPNLIWDQGHNGMTPQEPTHFTSASPNDLLMPFFLACKESYSIVTKEYSIIFPASSTWFSFSTDFLYLDWGMRHSDNTVVYSPGHFTASYVDHSDMGIYESPEIDEDVAKNVRNLVMYKGWCGNPFHENQFINNVLQVFSGVKALVMADRLHHVDDAGKELVWLMGELGDESRWLSELWSKETIDEERGLYHEPKTEQNYRHWIGDLLLWKDAVQYGLCREIVLPFLEDELETRRVLPGCRELPMLFSKSVTTAEVKNKLLKICGSEDNFRKLEGLDWEFVQGHHEYHGPLDLSQQIAYLNLVLDRLLPEYKVDGHGNTVPSENMDYIPGIVSKIEDLWREAIMDQLISEAEEMDYEQAF